MMGSGNSLGVGLNLSKYQKQLSFNYFDPYYTLDNISRGFNAFIRTVDYKQANLARFETDSGGLGVNFGFPIDETQRINFGLQAEYTELSTGYYSAQEIAEFIEDNGRDSLNFKLNLSWQKSTLNRGIFANRGTASQLSLQTAIPGSGLEFYKVRYAGETYFPVSNSWTLRLRTELGYGDSYGDTSALPFYEHFFAGGFGSIRGFETRTLGPRTTPPLDREGNPICWRDPCGDPFGGNLQIEASAELIFPLPFVEDNRQFRPSLFLDVGNVFNTKCPRISVNCFGFDVEEMKYSTGFSVTWLTGMGPMSFALVKAFNTKDYDEEEAFQFELGKTF